GFTVGVAGRTNANDGGGAGVAGLATGISTTKNAATGVVGIATASTGRQIGVQGQINTSDPNSTAADFTNNGSSTGMIIVGEGRSLVQDCDSPPCTDQVFSVDASGNVKANSFQGLNGNPISVNGPQSITSDTTPPLTVTNTGTSATGPLPLLVGQAPDATGKLAQVFRIDTSGALRLVGFNGGLLAHDTNNGSNPNIPTGFAIGGTEDAPGGQGILGVTTATVPEVTSQGTQGGVGVRGVANDPFGTGVVGKANSLTGVTNGVRGRVDSSTDFATGVEGFASATSGTVFGVSGDVNTPTAVGVQGNNNGDGGAGVRGFANGKNAFNEGVGGFSQSPNGTGVHGNNQATTGNGIGVLAEVQSPNGQAIQAKVPSSSGTLFAGLVGTGSNLNSVFNVDGNGNVQTTGTVNAAHFVGDGSMLTGLPGVSGVFVGSGTNAAINVSQNGSGPAAILSNNVGGVVLRAKAGTDSPTDILTVDSANGGLVSASSLAIGGGQTITQHLSTTATVQIPTNMSGGNCIDFPINVPGAADGDSVVVGASSDFDNLSGIQVTGFIGGPGTAVVRGCDINSGEDSQQNPPTQLTFRVDVWKHDPKSNDTGNSAGLVVATNSLTFQPTQVGGSSFLTVALLNPGSTPIGNINANSSDPTDFPVFQQCQTIGPNQSCQLLVGFTPTAGQQPTQPFSATLTISTTVNDVTNVAKVISLTGTGTAAPPP